MLLNYRTRFFFRRTFHKKQSIGVHECHHQSRTRVGEGKEKKEESSGPAALPEFCDEAPKLPTAHGDPLAANGEKAELSPWPNGADDDDDADDGDGAPPPPTPPPPTLPTLPTPPTPLARLAKLGADRPRFHRPCEPDDGDEGDVDSDAGLRWTDGDVAAAAAAAAGVGLVAPPPLTCTLDGHGGDENVADAGDLLALTTPGSSRLAGDV